jgi:serine/threonine protein kinase
MSIFEKGQEFLTKNSYYQPRKERDELDDSIAHFCNVVHAMLTGKAKEELAIPYEERDAEFINKYPSFTLSKCLGRGQAGVVFLGEDDDGNPIFAIKVIHLPGAVGAGLPIRRTFLIYQNVLKMIRHPNINQYLGWTVVDNEAQVYTAFCNNGSLTSKIMQDKNDPGIKDIVQLKSYLKQILFGLSYLHSHGIVHRY